MAEDRTMYRVFLGSPGDLAEEREAAKSVIADINAELGERLGFLLSLDRWEDTPPAHERAQGNINRVLEKCDIFVGMLYREWGSPSGKYSSGFEEEYRISLARYEKENRPTILMFFKKFEEFLQKHPPEPIEKILNFREELIAGYKSKFAEFQSTREFEKSLRKALTDFVFERQNRALVALAAPDSQTLVPSQEAGLPAKTVHTPLSQEGLDFARNFLASSESLGEGQQLAADDVARFRLLASAIGGERNDSDTIGAHDANLCFAAVPPKHFGKVELRGLLSSGVEHFAGQNVPIWRWYSRLELSDLIILSIISPQPRRAQAINVMTFIEADMGGFVFGREEMLRYWLKGDAAPATKVAALKYLWRCGRTEDVAAIQDELALGNSDTREPAAEALVWIKFRQGREAAIEELWKADPSSISNTLKATILTDLGSVDAKALRPGLLQRLADSRRAVATELSRRAALSEDDIRLLLEDDDEWVRLEGVIAIRKSSGIEMADAKRHLVKPTKAYNTLMLGRGARPGGQAAFRAYEKLSANMTSIPELQKQHEQGLDSAAYFSLARRQYARYAPTIRKYFQEALVNPVADNGGDSDWSGGLAAFLTAESPEVVARRTVLRDSMDVLCEKGDQADLPLVRKLLRGGVTSYSPKDFEYLGRVGEWQDIDLVRSIVDRHRQVATFGYQSDREKAAAAAVLSIGKARVEGLVRELAEHAILPFLLPLISDKAFTKLPDDLLTALLRLKSDRTRRVAAIKAAKCLPKTRLSDLLAAELTNAVYFYNVVHWLDFGISMDRDTVRTVCARLLSSDTFDGD